MVGTELTRNKLTFEDENDNNIKPCQLLEKYLLYYYYMFMYFYSICKRYNYQYNYSYHRDNVKYR